MYLKLCINNGIIPIYSIERRGLLLTTKVSTEVQNEALKIAKGTQKKAQTKEQTKLIAQGIEKGISEYKKQQKAKARKRDKQRKKSLQAKAATTPSANEQAAISKANPKWRKGLLVLPWLLLLASWCYFLIVS